MLFFKIDSVRKYIFHRISWVRINVAVVSNYTILGLFSVQKYWFGQLVLVMKLTLELY